MTVLLSKNVSREQLRKQLLTPCSLAPLGIADRRRKDFRIFAFDLAEVFAGNGFAANLASAAFRHP
jgi:hypothetical protein